jgi:hypothetical protein
MRQGHHTAELTEYEPVILSHHEHDYPELVLGIDLVVVAIVLMQRLWFLSLECYKHANAGIRTITSLSSQHTDSYTWMLIWTMEWTTDELRVIRLEDWS